MERNPWGTCAHTALRWSYGLLGRSESIPNVFGEMMGGTRYRTGMTMLDHRAQGAMIRKIVEDYLVGEHPIEHAFIIAYYLPKPTRERAAGGGTMLVDRFLPQRQQAVYAVAWWLLGQEGTGAHAIRGWMEIVAQYTLSRPSVRTVARLMRTRFENAKAAKEAAIAKMRDLHDRGLYYAEDALMQTGLIDVETGTYQCG